MAYSNYCHTNTITASTYKNQIDCHIAYTYLFNHEENTVVANVTNFLQSNILFYFGQNTFCQSTSYFKPAIHNERSTRETKQPPHTLVFIKSNVLIQKYNVKNKSIICNAL